MTRAEFEMFLLASSGLCVLMAAVNLLRVKSRGTSAYCMSGAFLAVAGALMLYRAGANTGFVGLLGLVAFVLLVADLMIRARDKVSGDRR